MLYHSHEPCVGTCTVLIGRGATILDWPGFLSLGPSLCYNTKIISEMLSIIIIIIILLLCFSKITVIRRYNSQTWPLLRGHPQGKGRWPLNRVSNGFIRNKHEANWKKVNLFKYELASRQHGITLETDLTEFTEFLCNVARKFILFCSLDTCVTSSLYSSMSWWMVEIEEFSCHFTWRCHRPNHLE